MTRSVKPPGYILFETLAALTVLSVGAVAVNRALYEVMLTRALARDYTQVRFLLEELTAAPELKFQVVESVEQGRFGGDLARFEWVRTIERAPIPLPELPSDLPEYLREELEERQAYCGKVSVTVRWTRAGQTFERTAVTLIPPSRIWLPDVKNPYPRYGEHEEDLVFR